MMLVDGCFLLAVMAILTRLYPDADPALPRRAGALLVDVPENAPDHEGHIVKNFRHFLVYFNFKIHLVIHAII
jgi:hypothetical protein